MPEIPRRSPWLLRAMTVLAGVAAALGLVVVAEYAARLLDPLTPQELANRDTFDFQAWTLGPCYRASFGRLVPVRPPRELESHVGGSAETFPLEKAPGVRRIVVVGESTGEMLEKQLAAMTAGCRDKVEILRCSASGSRPFIAVRRAEEALAWSPDAIVVAIGHNFMLPGPPSASQLRVNRSRLVHEAQRLLHVEPVAPTPPPPRTGPPTSLDELDPPAMGREAYRQILALAKPKGIEVVALVLSSNLWLQPNPGPGEETSPERAQARVQAARGDLDAALRTLAPGSGDGPLRAFDRARLHGASGDWAEARRDLELARDLEPMPTRASTAVTAAIRDAAQSGGARIIDVGSVFAPLAEHGIPGWDVYFDNCHPNPEPLALLARTVLTSTAPDAAASCSAPPPPEEHPLDAYSSLVEGPSRLMLPDGAASPELMRRRLDGPIVTLLRHHPNEAAAILERLDREILSTRPSDNHAALLIAFAGTARDSGRLDLARWCLDRSIATNPSAQAFLDRALLSLKERRDDEARADLEQGRKLAPAHPLVQALGQLQAGASP